jgi:lipopolysaccharide transport system ATP-binding protein
VTSRLDIRRAIGLEIGFDVLREGEVLIPNISLLNDEGLLLLVSNEVRSPWYLKPRDAGCYVATAWIPGNFLSEGGYSVTVAISQWNPPLHHVYETDAVSFRVVDTLDGDSVRGDYGGSYPGLVRPMLEWTTQYRAAV